MVRLNCAMTARTLQHIMQNSPASFIVEGMVDTRVLIEIWDHLRIKTTLSLECRIDLETVRAFVHLWQQTGMHLKHFILSARSFETSQAARAMLCHLTSTRLETLEFKRAQFSANAFLRDFAHICCIPNIVVSGVPGVLKKAMTLGPHTKRLTLLRCAVTDPQLRNSIPAMRNLQHLNLGFSRLKGNNLHELPNVESLNLRSNPFSKQGFANIVYLLQRPGNRLRKLSFDWVQGACDPLLWSALWHPNCKLIELNGRAWYDMKDRHLPLFQHRNEFFIECLETVMNKTSAVVVCGYLFAKFAPRVVTKRALEFQ